MGIRQRANLLLRGSDDGRVAVAEAGNGRAAAAVEIAAAFGIHDIDAVATHGPRRLVLEVAMQYVTHDKAGSGS